MLSQQAVLVETSRVPLPTTSSKACLWWPWLVVEEWSLSDADDDASTHPQTLQADRRLRGQIRRHAFELSSLGRLRPALIVRNRAGVRPYPA